MFLNFSELRIEIKKESFGKHSFENVVYMGKSGLQVKIFKKKIKKSTIFSGFLGQNPYS